MAIKMEMMNLCLLVSINAFCDPFRFSTNKLYLWIFWTQIFVINDKKNKNVETFLEGLSITENKPILFGLHTWRKEQIQDRTKLMQQVELLLMLPSIRSYFWKWKNSMIRIWISIIHNLKSVFDDISSFFSRYRKYKIVILTKKVGRGTKYSFGCTCNTGLRSTPSAHGVLIIYLYSNYLSDQGF